jgi:hypothetical protein
MKNPSQRDLGLLAAYLQVNGWVIQAPDTMQWGRYETERAWTIIYDFILTKRRDNLKPAKATNQIGTALHEF